MGGRKSIRPVKNRVVGCWSGCLSGARCRLAYGPADASGRKGIQPVKNRVVGCWHGYLSGASCRLAYGPADATATHCLLLQIGFIFLVPAHPGSPRKRPVKRVCVCIRLFLVCG